MTLANQIIEEARTWRNTPFLHQGRLKNLGVDCAGFIGEVARNVGINVDIPHDYKPQEDGTAMMRMLSSHLDFVPTEEIQPGDILALTDQALRDPDVPRHLAIVTEVREGTIFLIHASERGVREHRTNEHWRKRIHSVWRVKSDSPYVDTVIKKPATKVYKVKVDDSGTKRKVRRTRRKKAR
jgi:cell wall-associated NlpC family hydrolase